MSMLVGIEASAAAARGPAGVGSYVANMIGGLKSLSAFREDVEIAYFTNQDGGNVLRGPSTHRSHIPSRLLWMQTGLPWDIMRARPDVVHFPNYLGPLAISPRLPIIVTMYDMSVYRHPECQPAKTVIVHRALMPVVARRAALILTVSESARRDIVECLGIPADRIRVIPGGVAPQFQSWSSDAEPAAEGVLRAHGLSFPYILTVGTLEPRKNHARLIAAFTELVRQERLPHHLVLAGAHGWKGHPLREEVRNSPLAERIHILGYVPSGHLPHLYRGADVFAFPSLYEGFGLPLVEAFACGVPALISTDPALVEVAGGDGAVAVDPYSVGDIAAGLHCIITDGRLRNAVRTAGLTRARSYTWERCAATHLKLYGEVAAGRQRVTRAPARYDRPVPVIWTADRPADGSIAGD